MYLTIRPPVVEAGCIAISGCPSVCTCPFGGIPYWLAVDF